MGTKKGVGLDKVKKVQTSMDRANVDGAVCLKSGSLEPIPYLRMSTEFYIVENYTPLHCWGRIPRDLKTRGISFNPK